MPGSSSRSQRKSSLVLTSLLPKNIAQDAIRSWLRGKLKSRRRKSNRLHRKGLQPDQIANQ